MAKQDNPIVKHCVAVDISKSDFKVCYKVMYADLHIAIKWTSSFSNTVKGIQDFLTKLNKKMVADAALLTVIAEATGVYHEEFAYAVYRAGYDLKIILPSKTRFYAKSFSHNSKTDKSDAAMLAHYGLERGQMEKSWQPPSKNVLKIKRLCREYRQVQDALTVQQNQLHALEHAESPLQSIIKRMKEHIEFLKKMLKDITKEIQKAVKDDPEFDAMVQRLTTLPGVGSATATKILAETDCFSLFTSVSQVVRYAGYDVVHKESGTSVKGKSRISKKGNSHIRAALHFPAVVAVGKNEIFQNLKERIQCRSGIKMKGYTAVQRKLLCMMYTLTKSQTVYDFQKHLGRISSESKDIVIKLDKLSETKVSQEE